MARTSLRDGDPSRVGPYRLIARLGAGGMGVVYLGAAKDGRQFAVKLLRPEHADDSEFRVRFRHEVASLTRVLGECTVRVIEADTEGPRPFLVTEYADGPSLSEHVATAGPLPSAMLYGLAAGLAEALTAIHAAGVIHRDFKPSNVLLTVSGPKVIDFGIAQTLDATAVTRTGVAVGSPGFMAPEQVMGQAGQATDVFAWGLVLAFAASGQPPYGGGPSDVILYRVLHGAADVSAIPPELRPLVEAALAKNPAERPSASQLQSWLTRSAGAPADPGESPTQTVLARTWSPPASAGPAVAGQPRRRRRGPLVALTVATLAAVAAGTGLALLHSAAPTAARANVPATGATGTAPPRTVTTVSPGASAPLLVTDGGYSGMRPTVLLLGASSEISAVSWSEWQAPDAVGVGEFPLNNCEPTCAQGVTGEERVTIRLSGITGTAATGGGRFTTMIVRDYVTGDVVDNGFPYSAAGGTLRKP